MITGRIGERVVIYIYSRVYDWLASLLGESGQGRVQVEREQLPRQSVKVGDRSLLCLAFRFILQPTLYSLML